MLAHGAHMALADDIWSAWKIVQVWNKQISFIISSIRLIDRRTYRSKNCTPLIEAIPMYKNTPNNTDIGINRRSGAAVTDRPTNNETQNPETRCSFTSVMWGLSPGAWVLFANEVIYILIISHWVKLFNCWIYLDMMVTDDTCVTDRTVAAQCHGIPNRPQPAFKKHSKTISKCRPEPFFKPRSGLSTINSEICVSMNTKM